MTKKTIKERGGGGRENRLEEKMFVERRKIVQYLTFKLERKKIIEKKRKKRLKKR